MFEACRIPYRGILLSALASAPMLALTLGSAHAQTPPSPEGIWYTKGQESIIRVHTCVDDATQYCGTIVWVKQPNESDGTPKLDKYNKDPAKKKRPILGIDILLNMKADEDHWQGKAYNPEDGKLYEITFKVKSDKGQNDEADLRGCVLGFLCQTELFTRASDVPGGEQTATIDPKKHKKAAKATAKR